MQPSLQIKHCLFFCFPLVLFWKNKWGTDTWIQLTLHCCLPVSRNITTCLQRQDNPAGAPLHSPCQGLCVIMSSSLYIIQPITHHLPDDSNGEKKYWLKKIFFYFIYFFFLDSIFLAITWATPPPSPLQVPTSVRQSFCVQKDGWNISLFPAPLKQPQAKISLACDSISFTAEIFLNGWIRCKAVFPPDQCASP